MTIGTLTVRTLSVWARPTWTGLAVSPIGGRRWRRIRLTRFGSGLRSRFRSGLGRRFRGLSGVGSGSGRFRSGVTATTGTERHEKDRGRTSRDQMATEEGFGEVALLTTGHHLD
ncbi:MAG: hypothetical protein ACO3NQ_08060, partial [Ilumatobacteraceae bacterium]